MSAREPVARFGNLVATGLAEVSHNPADLDKGGWWAVTQTFEGAFAAFRFTSINESTPIAPYVQNVPRQAWVSSMSQREYERGVSGVRDDIARGWVYQVNLCRVLSASLAEPIDLETFYGELVRHNPAPHAGYLRIPELNIDIASASPELFLSRAGDTIMSSPIKGTAKTANGLLDKDSAENIMIVDLVRNDLTHACIKGSVNVQHLLRLEEHPGLVHLVSDVVGKIDSQTTWTDILAATSPPGSVSGAPKSSALETIARLEKSKRGIYCGAFGWVDADKRTASLAVGIRTFWQTLNGKGATLNFGTGAGITWESDPHGEWLETELKADRLLRIAAGTLG